MNYIEVVLLLLISLNSLFAQQSILKQNICNKRKYQVNCPLRYNFTCMSDKCTMDANVCTMLKNFRSKIIGKEFKILKTHLVKYSEFIREIKQCESDWQPNEVCLRPRNCQKLVFNNSTRKFNLKSEKCKCTGGKHSTECSNSRVCGTNKHVCKSFISELNLNKKLAEKLYLCQHQNGKVV